MPYLLDTHALLWVIGDSKQLSKKVIEIIENQENQIFVSSISLWEISLKFRLGKLNLSGIKPEDILSYLEKLNINSVELSPEEASTYHKLKESFHKDPFDRMIIWQCISKKYTLISKDSVMKKYKISGLKIIW
ncbi:type II toxin-antitoxin system VapC family toxin [Leptospira wolffii]|uniref:type II toxin-antitoxin system VapC family toxin n=1 Tax=Leptospira wolffii TaxID=409998 RepID=UPI0010844C8C|nr:type II toxin-antitoxin system VapC family toxin [Leptospira wolffii]TGK71461.1 type II toxin-antitoxin system VapC family toxin [Leptospira wolffii]TGL29262.1 type II toxin-antitoxin system VapC family toxin [Leptospira wolffii]